MSTSPGECSITKTIKSCNRDLAPGDWITWTIEVNNPGPDLWAELYDFLPPTLINGNWFSETFPVPLWPGGETTIPPGKHKIIVSGQVPPDACGSKTFTNTASMLTKDPELEEPFASNDYCLITKTAVSEPIIFGPPSALKVCPPFANDADRLVYGLVGDDEASFARMWDLCNCGFSLDELIAKACEPVDLTPDILEEICDLVIEKFGSEELKDVVVGCIEDLLTKEALGSLLQTGDLTP